MESSSCPSAQKEKTEEGVQSKPATRSRVVQSDRHGNRPGLGSNTFRPILHQVQSERAHRTSSQPLCLGPNTTPASSRSLRTDHYGRRCHHRQYTGVPPPHIAQTLVRPIGLRYPCGCRTLKSDKTKWVEMMRGVPSGRVMKFLRKVGPNHRVKNRRTGPTSMAPKYSSINRKQ